MVKKEFLACSSSATKQVCLPVAEAAFSTFVSGVLVGGFVPFMRIEFLTSKLEAEPKTVDSILASVPPIYLSLLLIRIIKNERGYLVKG